MTDSTSTAPPARSSSGSTTQSDGPMSTLEDVAREAAVFLQRMSQESRESQLAEAEREAPASSRRRKVPAHKRAPTKKANTAPPAAPIATQPAAAPQPTQAELQQTLQHQLQQQQLLQQQRQQPQQPLQPAVTTVINQPICHCAAMPTIHVHVQAAPAAPQAPQAPPAAPAAPAAPQAPQAPRVPQAPQAARHMETKSVGVTSSQPPQGVSCGNMRGAVWNVSYRTNSAISDDNLQLIMKIAKPEDVVRVHDALCHKIIAPSSDARIALQWKCTGVTFKQHNFGSILHFSTESALSPRIIRTETIRLLSHLGYASSIRADFWMRM